MARQLTKPLHTGCSRSQLEDQASVVASSSYELMLGNVRQGVIASASPHCSDLLEASAMAGADPSDSQAAKVELARQRAVPATRPQAAAEQLMAQPERGSERKQASDSNSCVSSGPLSQQALVDEGVALPSPFSRLPGPMPASSPARDPLVLVARDLVLRPSQVRFLCAHRPGGWAPKLCTEQLSKEVALFTYEETLLHFTRLPKHVLQSYMANSTSDGALVLGRLCCWDLLAPGT